MNVFQSKLMEKLSKEDWFANFKGNYDTQYMIDEVDLYVSKAEGSKNPEERIKFYEKACACVAYSKGVDLHAQKALTNALDSIIIPEKSLLRKEQPRIRIGDNY